MELNMVLKDIAHFTTDTHLLDGLQKVIESTRDSDADDATKEEIIKVAEFGLQQEAERGKMMMELLIKFGKAENIGFMRAGSEEEMQMGNESFY